jgi:hypothetical protein
MLHKALLIATNSVIVKHNSINHGEGFSHKSNLIISFNYIRTRLYVNEFDNRCKQLRSVLRA